MAAVMAAKIKSERIIIIINNNLLLIERYLQLQINSALHLMSLNIEV